MTERDLSIEEILKEGPPLDWYSGSGYKEKGIVTVVYSQKLLGMGGGKVKEHLEEWNHLTAHPVSEDGSPERIERARKALAEAEEQVTKITGFSPRQIADTRYELRQIFRGQKSAPFDFELY